MSIDDGRLEERTYTRQHDRIFQALVQQVTDLQERVQRLEDSLRRPLPSAERIDSLPNRTTDDVIASKPIETDDDISVDIASIGSTLDSVKRSLEQSREAERSTTSAPRWRTSSTRPAGWQPVTTRRN
ncbi:MAG: hypothetical protein ACR2P0_19290 [Acidimicrobiales bacterium]